MTGSIGSESVEAMCMVKPYRVTVLTASTNFQLARMPWFWSQGPISGKIVKLEIGNPSGALVSVRFWDQDLSNTTPPSRGSGSVAGALWTESATGSSASGTILTTRVDLTQVVSPEFYAGIAVQASDVNVAIYAEVRLK